MGLYMDTMGWFGTFLDDVTSLKTLTTNSQITDIRQYIAVITMCPYTQFETACVIQVRVSYN